MLKKYFLTVLIILIFTGLTGCFNQHVSSDNTGSNYNKSTTVNESDCCLD